MADPGHSVFCGFQCFTDYDQHNPNPKVGVSLNTRTHTHDRNNLSI